jgi:ribosomal protein S25
MWNENNRTLFERYSTGGIPSDLEYGEYLMREFMTLGFQVKHLTVMGGAMYAIALAVMNGAAKVMFLCKVTEQPMTPEMFKGFMSFRALYKADIYVLVTNKLVNSAGKQAALQNGFVVADNFLIGNEVVDLLVAAHVIPQNLGTQLVQFKIAEEKRAAEQAVLDELDRQRAEAEQAELARIEAEKAARRAEAEMTPLDKYRAGKYDSRLPTALAYVATMDVVSASGLARRMHIDQETAKMLLINMEELGVVGQAEPSKPRSIRMTQGMIEKTFGLRVRSTLAGIK